MTKSKDLGFSMRQVAARLDVHVATAFRWAMHGVRGRKLKTYMLGGRRYVRHESLEEFLNGAPAEPAADHGLRSSNRASTAAELLAERGI